MADLHLGTFYNGISSIAQNVTVSFDSNNGVFRINNDTNQTLEWNISNITFDERGDTLYLQHGNDPIQNLKISDIKLIAVIDQFRSEKGLKNLYQRLMDLNFKTHISIAVGILGLIVLGYIFVIPWVAEKSVILIPEEYDNKLGDTFFEQNMMFQEIDSAKTIALNRFARELKLKNNRKLNFTVVDAPVVNAFALPDGNVVIFSGILKPMKSYDQLVGLIGHEVSHVNNRHSMKMLCRNLSGYLFISAILGDVNGVMAIIGDNVNTLQSLSFSREFEHQADIDGFSIVTDNKANPQGMVDLFKQLQHAENEMGIPVKIPDFLSTHPVTRERIRYIKELSTKQPHPYEHNPKLQELFLKIKN